MIEYATMDYKKYHNIKEKYYNDLFDVLDQNEKEVLKVIFDKVSDNGNGYAKAFMYTDFRDNPQVWMEFFPLMETLQELGMVIMQPTQYSKTFSFVEPFINVFREKFHEI